MVSGPEAVPGPLSVLSWPLGGINDTLSKLRFPLEVLNGTRAVCTGSPPMSRDGVFARRRPPSSPSEPPQPLRYISAQLTIQRRAIHHHLLA